MASQREAALGTFWGTVERATTQGISFIVVLLLARLLGPSNYGLVTLAATIALLGQTLLGETFSQALIQTKTLEPQHNDSIFWLLFVAGVASTGLVLIGADWLAALFGEAALGAILRALSPLLLLTALQAVPTALFKRELNFRALAAASAGGTVLGGVVGVGLAFAGFGPWSLVANLLVQNTVVTAGIWRQSPFRPSLSYSYRHLRELWAYGQYTFLLRIAAFTANQSPRLLVGYLFGPAALGVFGLGLRICDVMLQLLVLPAANVTIPVIAKVRHDPKRLERAILSATQLTGLITVPAFVGLALIAPIGVPLAFGQQWTQSVLIIQGISIAGVVGASGLLYLSILGGLGRPDLNLSYTLVSALLSLTLLFTAPWGITAATFAYLARAYIMAPILPLIVARLTGISGGAQFRIYLPILSAAGIMALCIEGLMATLNGAVTPLSLVTISCLAGAASYGLALFIFARPTLLLGVSLLGHLRPKSRTFPGEVDAGSP